jgi:hypothetical protein
MPVRAGAIRPKRRAARAKRAPLLWFVRERSRARGGSGDPSPEGRAGDLADQTSRTRTANRPRWRLKGRQYFMR